MSKEVALMEKTSLGIGLVGSDYLTKLSTALTSDELQMICAKYAEKRIDQLSGPELLAKVADCLRRIHVITGWNLPDDKKYIQLLTEELMAKLKEDFYMLNFQEVTRAMRHNGVGVKDWGKNMNLDLISGVLANYCTERTRLSQQEERMNSAGVRKANTEPEARLNIAVYYQKLVSGYRSCTVMPREEIHLQVLKKDGLLKEGEYIWEFFDRMLEQGVSAIYYKQEKEDG